MDSYVHITCVGDLVEYLEQFDPNAEVWLGDRYGISNQATEAWVLNGRDVIIDCDGEFEMGHK